MQISKDGKQSFIPSRAKGWLAEPLIQSLIQKDAKVFKIEKQVNREFDKVVIVNCLDSCFGHIFSKVWNTYTLIENKPDWGIIAIIPERCKWLLPEDIAEVWSVSIGLKQCDQTIGGLDEFVKDQLSRFEKISFSRTYTHLDHTKYIDMGKVLKIPRFNLGNFLTTAPQITFVLREDRFWLNSHLMDFLYKASRKFKVEKLIFPLLLWRQRQLVNQTGKMIFDSVPNAKLSCTGLGTSGKFLDLMDDHRVDHILSETEIRWNAIYSKSHLVIGVHGSHMLIPSALAAGFVNIVPRYKIEHLVEDTVLPYTNRMLQFLGRFLDEFSSPKLVSKHISSMVKDFDYVNRNLEQEPEGKYY
ncbi:hypothetical protein [Cognataquiflexum rubidum]|uniref:hypothetical protein n=1 Tax=Cognataquiflexum rubidum TaxID=2922273 RepID=UPI001F140676|nr:hypothetical protein [Cognataquiflexum rubidum]MCH6236495.1 hypothetical protein [Cognataquiflexum rubidum]